MKFICERDTILKEISIAQEIISSRNSLSILSNVLLEAVDNTLLIRATDLKVSFETRIPVEVKLAGTCTVFCDKLLGIIRSVPQGLIEFENSNDIFKITPVFKKIDFSLKSISADKFPETQEFDQDKQFQISQADFCEMIEQTVFAVSDDETRYFLNGVYLENKDNRLVMVATDGKRLSYIAKEVPISLPEFKGVIVPPKSLNLVRKQSSGEGLLTLAITDKQIFFEFDSQKVASSLIDGQFPNYNRVIPENQQYEITIDKLELIEAIKRVSLMVEKSKRVFVYLSNNSFRMETEVNEIGQVKEEISCAYEGPECRIALNIQYLHDPLKNISDDKIVLKFTETTKAMTMFSGKERDYFHIIMPMQLD